MTVVATRTDELSAIYDEHGASLRRLCQRRLGPGPDAEDAVQETLLRAWSALSRFDHERAMWPWLATIASNVCVDVHRRRRTDALRRSFHEPAPLGADEAGVGLEATTVVREAVALLPQPAATVLFLRDVEGWDYERIGAHLNRKPGAARTAVTRARHQLRAHVEEIARSRGQWPLGAVMGPIWAGVRHGVARLRSLRLDEVSGLVAQQSVAAAAVAIALVSGVAVGDDSGQRAPAAVHEVAPDAPNGANEPVENHPGTVRSMETADPAPAADAFGVLPPPPADDSINLPVEPPIDPVDTPELPSIGIGAVGIPLPPLPVDPPLALRS